MGRLFILLLAVGVFPVLAVQLQSILWIEGSPGRGKSSYLTGILCSAGAVVAVAVGFYCIAGHNPLTWSSSSFLLLLLAALAGDLLWLLFRTRPVYRHKEHPLRRELYVVCGLLLAVIVLETTAFNFRAFESLRFEPITGYSVAGENIRMTMEENGACQIRTSGDTIELLDIGQEVKNMRLSVRTGNGGAYTAKVTLFATDEANALYFALPQRMISSQVERTQYFRLHLSGDSEKLKIQLTDFEEDEAVVEVQLNTQVPYSISLLRLAAVFAGAVFLLLIRPGSPLYRYRLRWKLPWQRMLIFGYAALQLVLLAGLTMQNNTMVHAQQVYAHHAQYQELARAFARGELFIDDEPSDSLRSMENPYDTLLRRQVVNEQAGETYRWDTSYYEGKYYVYFGVLPVLLFYLPFYLLTGQDFQTVWGIVICEAFWIMGVILLLSALARRYFPKTPLLVFLLLCMTFINGCGLLWIAQSPSFYCLPILLAAVLAVWALYFWISAQQGETLSKGYLFAGGLCAALTAASRPQFLVVCVPAVALFWDAVFHRRTLLSTKSLGATAALAVPFFVVAAGVMYYNAARFGSVFDFGANYNLTTNDMTRRGLVPGRIPLGFFTYFFQPPAISSQFPYLKNVSIETGYMGMTITEAFFGGAFATNLTLLFGLFPRCVKRELKEKRLYAFTLLALAASALVVVADTEMAGLLQRYITDFAWLLALAAAIVAMAMFEKWRAGEMRRGLLYVFAAFCALSLLYDLLLYFSPGETSIARENPAFYYTVSSLVRFWA